MTAPSPTVRSVLLCAAMLCAATVQGLLRWHVDAAEWPQPLPLTRPFAEFPLQLGDWSGHETPLAKDYFAYGDDHLHRTYVHRRTGQTVSLWMVYSRTAENLRHFPEVCMGDLGHREDLTQRRKVQIDDKAPLQCYRFYPPAGGPGQWIFYWTYTLGDLKANHRLSSLQRLTLRRHAQASSLSIELFAPALGRDDGEAAEAFCCLVDQAVSAHLPSVARRGSSRGQYVVVDPGGLRQR
jgi:hypothetical protein